MNRQKKPQPPAKRKMSEMISEMATGFLDVDCTAAERQNRLNAACSAWNMACSSPEMRERQLEQYAESFLQHNPGTSPSDVADNIKDLELLIEQKLKLFPDDHRQVVDARVVGVGSKFRIEVASATLR